jgi:hypothetical protein
MAAIASLPPPRFLPGGSSPGSVAWFLPRFLRGFDCSGTARLGSLGVFDEDVLAVREVSSAMVVGGSTDTFCWKELVFPTVTEEAEEII